MLAQVEDLASDSGKLISATGVAASPGRFHSLALIFVEKSLRIRCDDDTDEIVVDVTDIEVPNAPIDSFSDLIGSEIEYAWELTNHRGYTDAFQIRFISGFREEAVVQFEVTASTISINRLNGEPQEASSV